MVDLRRPGAAAVQPVLKRRVRVAALIRAPLPRLANDRQLVRGTHARVAAVAGDHVAWTAVRRELASRVHALEDLAIPKARPGSIASIHPSAADGSGAARDDAGQNEPRDRERMENKAGRSSVTDARELWKSLHDVPGSSVR